MQAVDGVSFELAAGEILAIVGESGCGKSVTAQTLMGLTRAPNATIAGSVNYRGRELNRLDDDQLRHVRGEEIAMIFQDPMCSLNPVYRVGDQITEMIQAHRDVSKKEAHGRAVDLLRSVGIPNPERRVRQLPPRVLRRHAPARHDRNGALTRTRGADRRRADHRARRHRPGPDPAADRGAQPRPRPGGGPDHPRPRGGRRGSPTGSWSCAPDRSSRMRRSTKSSTTPSTPTHGACWVRSPGSISPGPHGCHRSRAPPSLLAPPTAVVSPRAAHTPSRSATSRRRSRHV